MPALVVVHSTSGTTHLVAERPALGRRRPDGVHAAACRRVHASPEIRSGAAREPRRGRLGGLLPAGHLRETRVAHHQPVVVQLQVGRETGEQPEVGEPHPPGRQVLVELTAGLDAEVGDRDPGGRHLHGAGCAVQAGASQRRRVGDGGEAEVAVARAGEAVGGCRPGVAGRGRRHGRPRRSTSRRRRGSAPAGAPIPLRSRWHPCAAWCRRPPRRGSGRAGRGRGRCPPGCRARPTRRRGG